MNTRSWAAMAGLLHAAVVMAWLLVAPSAKLLSADDQKGAADKQKAAKETADVFGLTKLHELHLELTAKEWEKMQQVTGGKGFPGGPGGFPKGPGFPPKEGPGGVPPKAEPGPAPRAADDPAGAPAKPGDELIERHKNAAFGLEFPWAKGQLTEDGKTYKDVGLRYKGNASYMASSRSLKRNIKFEFDHYDDKGRYHGLKTINLNAGAIDASRAREAVSYSVFRAAGVPAPRTAFALLTLTVPGKYDRELVGLYTMVEQVDKSFLKDRFQNGKGLLMKPERLRGLEYFGEDWERYKERYQPKHEPTKKEAQRLIEFTKLINRGSDEQFRKDIGSYLDIEGFLRFIAVNAMVVNLDSFLTLGHNYYIYLNPETNKFVFIPWDLDLSMAGFPMAGSPDQQTDLSLTHPYPGENRLMDRLMAIQEVNERYQKILRELSATCFSKEKLLKDLDAITSVTKEPLAKERKAVEARKEGGGVGFGPPGGGMFGRSQDVHAFIEKRTASVVAQLEGKSKGFIPQMGFGPGGPGGRPGGFGPGNFMARPLLEVLDGDKNGKLAKDEFLAGARRFFKECDKDGKGKIDEKALSEGLTRIMPAPPGFGPPPGGAPGAPQPPGRPAPGGVQPGPGGGFFIGPQAMLAPVLMRRADTDRSGKVTLDQFLAAAESLFKESDKDQKGNLDEVAIAAGINALLPRPPGFGPGGPGFGPGPRPGEPKKDEPRKEEPKP